MIFRFILKSFFNSNKLLSIAFFVLMVICLAGGLFGVNYTYCNVDYYNEYLSSQKLYTVYNDGLKIKDSVNCLLEKYLDKIDCTWATFNVSTSTEDIEIEALIYLSQDYYDLFAPSYGKMLSEDDIKNGAKKIVLASTDFDATWIGKHIKISDVDYAVIGLSASQYFIPFFSQTDTKNVGKIQIVLSSPNNVIVEKDGVYRRHILDISRTASVGSR